MNPSRLLTVERLFEMSGGYWQSCILHAAVKINLFTKIGRASLTAGEISRKLKANKRAVTVFLNALVAMGLLAKKYEFYANTSISAAYLAKNSEKYIGHIILHHHYVMNSWIHLDEAVKTGQPVRDSAKEKDELRLESFLMGMFNMAMRLAPRLVKKMNISRRVSLLDLGGGPGTYAIHFCLNNPRLKATVCDLPATRPFAESVIKKFGLKDRIDFKSVDYLRDAIPGNYDVAWLSHILHQEGPKEAQKIIQKAVTALNPGGMIVIHDFILSNTLDAPLFPAVFSLNMLLNTKNGQSYSEEQIKDMLITAGVRKIKRIFFDSPNGSGVILGEKKREG